MRSSPPPLPDVSADWLLRIERYVAGEGSAVERAQVEAWAVADASHGAYLAWAQQMLGAYDRVAAPQETTVDAIAETERALAGVHARLIRARGRRAPAGRAFDPRWHGVTGWPIAAAFLIAVGGVVALGIARHGSPAATREYATAIGQRLTVTLADGTRLTLAPASRVRLAAGYGVEDRTVQLEGEASFSVVHDAAHPFAVRTSHVTVRDVGTTFVVRAYADDLVEHVAVQTGRVDVWAASSQATPLGAGDLATIGDTGVSVQHAANLATWTAWVQGGLVFEDTPLRQVVQDMSRAFGVRITIADSALLARHITAKLSGQTLDLALDAVTLAVGAHYERTERGAIVIRSGQTGVRDRNPSPRPPLVTAGTTGAGQ